VELLHGQFYSEFNNYIGTFDKGELHVHTPQRFNYDLDVEPPLITTDMW